LISITLLLLALGQGQSQIGQELVELLLALVGPHLEEAGQVYGVVDALQNRPVTQHDHVDVVDVLDLQAVDGNVVDAGGVGVIRQNVGVGSRPITELCVYQTSHVKGGRIFSLNPVFHALSHFHILRNFILNSESA